METIPAMVQLSEHPSVRAGAAASGRQAHRYQQPPTIQAMTQTARAWVTVALIFAAVAIAALLLIRAENDADERNTRDLGETFTSICEAEGTC